jgi:hypothetical protein
MPDGNQTLSTTLEERVSYPDETPHATTNINKQPPAHDPTPRNLAYLVTVGFFGLLFLLCFQSAPAANLAMLNIVLGSLGTAWVGAMAYFFGATQAGRTKDWMLFQSKPSSPST